MNHELQSQTQLAEATPQMQPESRTFMQNVLARGRFAVALGGSVLAVGGLAMTPSSQAESFDKKEAFSGKADESFAPEVEFGFYARATPQYAVRGGKQRFRVEAYGTAERFSVRMMSKTANLPRLLQAGSSPRWRMSQGKPTWFLGPLQQENLKIATFQMTVAGNARIGSKACVNLRLTGSPAPETTQTSPEIEEKVVNTRLCSTIVRRAPA